MPKNYPDSREVINESVLVELYKKSEAETRCKFLSSVLKDGQSVDGVSIPYPMHMFKSEVQLVISLVCQVLGLDEDCHVGEVILGFLLRMNSSVSESQSTPAFSLDEYLAESIHL